MVLSFVHHPDHFNPIHVSSYGNQHIRSVLCVCVCNRLRKKRTSCIDVYLTSLLQFRVEYKTTLACLLSLLGLVRRSSS